MLVAFIKAILLRELSIVRTSVQIASVRALRVRSLQEACADHSLAEKPKVEELQMDWLRSENLKEVKEVTAPLLIIAGRQTWCSASEAAESRESLFQFMALQKKRVAW
jgi:hypothetical protein